MARRRKPALRAAAVLLVALLAAAGTAAGARGPEPTDPLENANRVSHRFGLFLDRILVGPIARGYVRITPLPIRIGVTNFVDNITYPSVIINDFLQGKFEQGLQDSMRFVVNTTFGLVGFFDVATPIGLERHDEDLGQTLAVWGVKEIAYLELPFVGPNSVRDIGNLPLVWQTSLIALADLSGLTLPVALLGAVNTRANLDEVIGLRDRVALDTYVFTRESYRRRRDYLIRDGEMTEEDEDLYSAPNRRQEVLLSLVHDSSTLGPGDRRFGVRWH